MNENYSNMNKDFFDNIDNGEYRHPDCRCILTYPLSAQEELVAVWMLFYEDHLN